MVKVVFLGTNGWYDSETGNTTCILLESTEYFIILDAGNGIHKLDRYIDGRSGKPICLFLSHFHLDHIAGLHILNKFHFPRGMKIFGQPGSNEILEKVIDRPFTIPFPELGYPVEVHELSEGDHALPFPTGSRFLRHSSPCMGYRFELDGKIIAYCPDTGYCENAVKLAKDADLLITECSWKIGQRSEDWPHLNPEDAVRIAVEAGARKLALVHFDANTYRSLEERMDIELMMKDRFHELIVAVDDLVIELE